MMLVVTIPVKNGYAWTTCLDEADAQSHVDRSAAEAAAEADRLSVGIDAKLLEQDSLDDRASALDDLWFPVRVAQVVESIDAGTATDEAKVFAVKVGAAEEKNGEVTAKPNWRDVLPAIEDVPVEPARY